MVAEEFRWKMGEEPHWERALTANFIEYVQKYASKEHADEAGEGSDDSDEMSSVGSYDDDEEDEEPAGTMEV